jgi:hypothetical protein
MPIYDKPIPNPCADLSRPPLIHWKGQRLEVTEILDRFVVTGRWWEFLRRDARNPPYAQGRVLW